MTHTQTFFPESLILDVIGRSPGLRLVVYLPIQTLDLGFKTLDIKSKTYILKSTITNSGFVDNNKLNSLQLRVQPRILNLRFRILDLGYKPKI